jgi:hypothetical protein
MELKGKHVAVLAEDLYEDLELWYPVHRFREAGAKVTIVGGGAGGYSSKHGYPVVPDATAEKVNAADFGDHTGRLCARPDAPSQGDGGPGPRHVRERESGRGDLPRRLDAGFGERVAGPESDLLLRHQGRPCERGCPVRGPGSRSGREPRHVAKAGRSAGILPDDPPGPLRGEGVKLRDPVILRLADPPVERTHPWNCRTNGAFHAGEGFRRWQRRRPKG